jgi:hypothetical protein
MDGDGLPTIGEAFFGTDPRSPDVPSPFDVTLDKTSGFPKFVIHYTPGSLVHGIDAAPSISSDLATWSTGTTWVFSNAPEADTLVVSETTGGGLARFVRLIFTESNPGSLANP